MRKVWIAEIMRESGLSRATIDRVLNGRAGVHPRTRQIVETTLTRLTRSSPIDASDIARADIVLRVGRGMMGQMRTAFSRTDTGNSQLFDMWQKSEDEMLALVGELCRDPTRPLIVTAKNTDRMVSLLALARSQGKTVIALISDLSPAARDAFVGIDNRAAGQTAAFLIGRALGDRPTTVGVVLGDHAYRCHEDREIGFRTALRAHFPKVILADEAQGEDNPEKTRDAVRRMMKDQPAIGGLYNVGGGNAGLVEALREAGRARDLFVVGHEANDITVPFLQLGSFDFVIAQDPAQMLAEAMRLANTSEIMREPQMIDFGVYTRFNLPSYGRVAVGR